VGIKIIMGSVAALGLEHDLVESLKTRQGSNERLRIFHKDEAWPDIIRHIKEHHDELDVVLLGAGVPDPVQMVQRIHAIDKFLSIIVLVNEKDILHTRRAIQFAPYIGDQVQCVVDSDLELILNSVMNSARTTRTRRHHTQLMSQINRSMFKTPARSSEMPHSPTHFDKLLDIAPVGIALMDPKGNILAWNKSAQQLSGLSEREAISSQFPSIFSLVGDELHTIVRRAGSSSQAITAEATRQRNGKVNYFEITVGNLDQEHSQNYMLVIQDITARHEDKIALVQAKQLAEASNEAKSRFLANMSHEIRTPIGAMLGFLDLLKQPGNSASDAHDYIATIDRNGHQLLRLIDDILDLSRIEAGKVNIVMARFSLMQLLADVQSMMNFKAEEKGLRFLINFLTGIPDHMVSDPVRMRQVLYNLIGNAIKFTEKGSVELNVSFARDALSFAVTDTGIGIADDQRSILFQPFMQADQTVARKFGGTGLGLALSRRLAEVLGGSLVLAQSQPQVGSTFVFSVPANTSGDFKLVGLEHLHKTSEADHQTKDDDSKFPLRHMRLLLVEDSADNRLLITRLLKGAGAEVDFATDGEAGVAKALSQHYDVVLMDVQMPICDGLEATRRLRKAGYSRPVIALTAHAMEEERKKSFIAGCTDHLTKPINRAVLIQTISRYKG
jgi:PAS domain S-box-containing protein